MWLGIDIGTGGSRALLVDGRGAVRAGFTAAHEDMRMERPLWAEQRPENWWDASVKAIRGVLAKAGISGSEVKGIGLSGQMHGLVILDAEGAVIRPSLIWCDQRSQAQVDFVNATLGKEKVVQYTANPVLTGFTLPKLLWVRDNEPQNFERVRKVLLPKDYVRYCLTGEYASEVSDASGTAMFDVVNRRWSWEMMDGLGLDRSILPKCYESSDVTGHITPAVGTDRVARRDAGGWRRRRPGVRRRRERNRGIGRRILHPGHLRRGLRPYGAGGVRSGGARPHLLPCGAR
jgi:xylulokinase